MRLRTCLLAATVVALSVPTAAQADFQALYDDYRAEGEIDGCGYSPAELASGLGEIPSDVREYDPGFSDALNGALEQRAAGCGEEQSPAGESAAVLADDGSPGPPRPQAQSSPAGGDDGGTPAVLVAMIALLAASLGAAALMATASYFGWDPVGRLAPAGGLVRGLRERIADGVWAMRDRLGL